MSDLKFPPAIGSGKHFRVADSPESTIRPSATECAWAAGFFDGEGTVTIAAGKRADCRWPVYNMRVLIGQNDIRPLEWIRDRWGGTIVARAAFGTRKQHHLWTCFARGSAVFLQDVRPFLQIKGERADLALKFHASRCAPGSSAKREEQEPFLASCREEMLRLNGYQRRTA